MDDVQGLVGGAYRLDHPIGGEGPDAAWLAHDPQGRPVRVTFLDPRWGAGTLSGPGAVVRRNVVTSIRHQNLVGVIDIMAAPSGVSVVTEHVTGPTVRSYFGSHGPLSPDQVVQVAAAVAQGLAALHAHSLVHGDIRPETVVLDTGSNPTGAPIPRLDDVALSLIAGEPLRTRRPASGAAPRAPEYAGVGIASPASDLYALGAMLAELAGGSPPATSAGQAAVPPSGRPGGVPDNLWNVIAWLLQPDPTARPARAELVAQALSAPAAPRVGVAHPPSPPQYAAPRPAAVPAPAQAVVPRHRARTPAAVATATLAVIALAGGGWWFTHRGSSTTVADQTVPLVATPTPTPEAATTVTATATTTVTATATPKPSPSATTMSPADAQAALRAARTSSLAALGAPNDGWILQLSSKADGTTDRLQTTRSGSHTFHLADIYEQYLDLQHQLSSQGVAVYMVESSDFGPQVSGQTYWTVVATPSTVVDQSSGTTACRQLFPTLSGAALLDTCMPRQYSAPS